MRGSEQQLCTIALAVRTNAVVGPVLCPSVQLTSIASVRASWLKISDDGVTSDLSG